MDYLYAVNTLLRKIGTRQVSSVDIQHPDVVDAKAVLDHQVSNLLNRGWWFNKKGSVKHEPDSAKRINLGSNVLRFEPSDETKCDYPNLALHGNKVYDADKNTYELEQAIVIDEYIDLPWAELPHTARMYVTYKAAAEYIEEKIDDVSKAAKAEREAREHYIDLTGDELRTEKPNMLNSPNARRMRSGVRPYGMRGY